MKRRRQRGKKSRDEKTKRGREKGKNSRSWGKRQSQSTKEERMEMRMGKKERGGR